MLPFPFVFFSQNLFEPLRLSICRFLIGETGVLQDDELFAHAASLGLRQTARRCNDRMQED